MRRDVHCSVGFSVILEESRNGHEEKVVLAFAEGGALLRKHTDHGVNVTGHSNHFADRRLMREQMFLDVFPDDCNASGKGYVLVI